MRFMKNYGKIAHYAPAYAVNDEFSRVLHQQMEFFSSSPSADTINRVRGEVNEASFMRLLFLCPYCFFMFAYMFAYSLDVLRLVCCNCWTRLALKGFTISN